MDIDPPVNVTKWAGTAVTTSATTTLPEVDAKSISDDATAANNLELMFDGTGYAGGTTKLQVDQVQQAGITNPITGTVSNVVGAPTVLNVWSSDIAAKDGAGDANHFIGRRMRFTSGNLINQTRPISAYVIATAEGKFTLAVPFTQAPANADAFCIEI